MSDFNIGLRIKEIRKENKLTQIDFAKEVGISQTHVSKIEKGIENPSETLIKFICYKFYVNELWLKKGDGFKTEKSDFDNIFHKARYDYEKGLKGLNKSDELIESTFAYWSACEILNCEKLKSVDFNCLKYLENINKLFSLMRGLFDISKDMVYTGKIDKNIMQDTFNKLFPQIEYTIKETLNELSEQDI